MLKFFRSRIQGRVSQKSLTHFKIQNKMKYLLYRSAVWTKLFSWRKVSFKRMKTVNSKFRMYASAGFMYASAVADIEVLWTRVMHVIVLIQQNQWYHALLLLTLKYWGRESCMRLCQFSKTNTIMHWCCLHWSTEDESHACNCVNSARPILSCTAVADIEVLRTRVMHVIVAVQQNQFFHALLLLKLKYWGREIHVIVSIQQNQYYHARGLISS